MYSSASNIHQSVKVNTYAKVLNAKLALNGTGLDKVLAVGPSSVDTSYGSPLGDYLSIRMSIPTCSFRMLAGV